MEVGGRAERVRLIGIDTPELRDPDDPVECFGAEAAARTRRMLPPGRSVWLERDVSDRDRDDRLLRYVWFAGREDAEAYLANDILVREGFAVAGTDQPDSRYADRFASAQQAARVLDRGPWAACGGADTPLGGAAPTPARILRPTPTPRPGRPTPTPAAVEGYLPSFPTPAAPAPTGGSCDPSYPGVCIPSAPPDLDCGEVGYVGFAVVLPDPHGFDRDQDGIGCE